MAVYAAAQQKMDRCDTPIACPTEEKDLRQRRAEALAQLQVRFPKWDLQLERKAATLVRHEGHFTGSRMSVPAAILADARRQLIALDAAPARGVKPRQEIEAILPKLPHPASRAAYDRELYAPPPSSGSRARAR